MAFSVPETIKKWLRAKSLPHSRPSIYTRLVVVIFIFHLHHVVYLTQKLSYSKTPELAPLVTCKYIQRTGSNSRFLSRYSIPHTLQVFWQHVRPNRFLHPMKKGAARQQLLITIHDIRGTNVFNHPTIIIIIIIEKTSSFGVCAASAHMLILSM